jgi:hypothetical protein
MNDFLSEIISGEKPSLINVSVFYMVQQLKDGNQTLKVLEDGKAKEV